MPILEQGILISVQRGCSRKVHRVLQIYGEGGKIMKKINTVLGVNLGNKRYMGKIRQKRVQGVKMCGKWYRG